MMELYYECLTTYKNESICKGLEKVHRNSWTHSHRDDATQKSVIFDTEVADPSLSMRLA